MFRYWTEADLVFYRSYQSLHSLLVVASRPQVVDQEAASSDWKFEGIAPVIY